MAQAIAIGRDDLIKIITKPEFYEQAPEFVSVGNAVQAVWADYSASARSRCCGPDPAILFPAIEMVFSLLRSPEEGPAAQASFKRYMVNKRGHAVGEIRLYFRRGREPFPDHFEF